MSTVFYSLASFAIVVLLAAWAHSNLKEVFSNRRDRKESRERALNNINDRIDAIYLTLANKQDKK